MGGGTQWKQPSAQQILRITCANGSTDMNYHTMCEASAPIRKMLDPPTSELMLDLSHEGLGVLGHWLTHGELDGRCIKAGTLADLKRLCKAYQTGQMLEVEAKFLDKVLDCVIDCVTEADHLTISDIESIARYLMRTFKEETGGRRFLRAWLIMGHMELARDELGYASKIARLTQRASGDILPVSYYKSLREHSSNTSQELPWELYRCHYHLHGPETRCFGMSSMDWGESSSSENGEMSEVDQVDEFGEMSEVGEESEEGEESGDGEDSGLSDR
ncbi:hypothetical protein LTR27_010913 [Elasticomyces elasticus]|nr:hypothetical protein LTR27_010913 [Elasticomyces elasticus]